MESSALLHNIRKELNRMHENDMQLPYDRCVKIDQEVDALLEEEKKKQQLNERKAKLIEDSKKSRHFAIYKWLGPNLMLERVCGNILWFVLCVSTGFLILLQFLILEMITRFPPS